MDDYGRRIVVDQGFEAVLGETSRAIRDEGLQVIARIDVRDNFWRDAGRDFRQYYLLEVWSPEVALEAFRHDLEVGTILPVTFAVFELADGETAVVANDPFVSLAADPAWRKDAPSLAALADEQNERVGRVLARLRHGSRREPRVTSAA